MRILIVDDEEGIRRFGERVLSEAGYQCASCGDGRQATERLGEGWDLVLTDLMMPGGVDGLEVLRRARAAANADAILMTGHPDMDSAVGALRDGAYDYLIKPFGPAQLLAAVKRVLEKRRLSRELAREQALRGELDGAYARLKGLESVRRAFGQFVTPEVAQRILEAPDLVMARGEHRVVTVLFADVRGFTPYAGRVAPEEAVERLNEVLTVVIDAVRVEGGIVNKFLGDGLMAVFGAPMACRDHAGAAARAALRACGVIEARARDAVFAGRAGLRMGFGINTGEAVAGCLGSAQRAEYTVIGHAVNLAQRLESAAEPGRILVGPRTAGLLCDRYTLVHRFVRAQGVAAPVPAAELRGPIGKCLVNENA
ncbi:MAG: adenylate/guanylate cyclase domain-containing protein [Elusimicrobiota bacterium]|nr:adenylate/guanylate cyclase domain-containing protein [Elusimicrobiota bacterium]